VLRQLGPDQGPAPAAGSSGPSCGGCFTPGPPLRRGDQPRRRSLAGARVAGGRTYRELIEARRERQLVFGNGEVIAVAAASCCRCWRCWHGQELVHGDLCPANLLRRDRDGLPVLLDFGLTTGLGNDSRAATGATPGYAPPELGAARTGSGLDGSLQPGGGGPGLAQWRGARRVAGSSQPLPGVGRVDWRSIPRFQGRHRTPDQRRSRPAFQLGRQCPGGVSNSCRCPRAQGRCPGPTAPWFWCHRRQRPARRNRSNCPKPSQQRPSQLRRPSRCRRCWRDRASRTRRRAVEGRLWPLVVTLALSAVVGISLGWWLLGRSSAPSDTQAEVPLPAAPLQACHPPRWTNASSCSIA